MLRVQEQLWSSEQGPSSRGRAFSRRRLDAARPEELLNRGANFDGVRLERKMPGVQESNLRIGNVPPIRLRAGWHKERVVLSPHSKQRRAARTELFLELWIEGDVAGVVQEQIELNLLVAGTSQKSRI